MKVEQLQTENSAAGGASELTDVLERMRARADNAYCDYIGQLRRDECLGWEIKVERGKFGEAEMKAHCAAAEKLGRHRALHEAANMLAEVLRSNLALTKIVPQDVAEAMMGHNAILTAERDAAISAAVAAEREAHAAVCIAQADRLEGPSDACGIALVCAGLILARTAT